MHGNNGSIDNDPAAAMRYTESRLSLYAEALITDIKKKIVPFIENFDGSEEEPTVLPSLMPNLLINGASGIAAGYATNIPPFNAQELLDALIKRIDSPECKLETIINIMPGPDFPTGGIILNKENMKDIYETGRGRIFIRSKIELASKKQAFITQIPYEVNKADLIDEINECADKFDTLNIKDCHDETDQNGLSICINFSDTENFEFVKNFLFKNTSLQISYNFNMIAIKDRKPCMFSIFTYLDSFIQHCENIVLNSTKFDLAEVKKRKEVVVGLIKAIKMIDVIIDLIKKSTNKQNAKEKLVAQYKFSEVQAESIVSLRLYSLSNSDVTALEHELSELNKLIDEYTKIISDKDYRNSHIKNIFRGFKKLFKFPRRTQFSEESVANIKIESSEVVEDKDVYVVVTKDGYIKNVPQRSFESSVYEEMGLRENDIQIFQTKTSQKNKLIFVTNKGNYFATPIHKIESDK
jgi:topoisomerase-4 subunit A